MPRAAFFYEEGFVSEAKSVTRRGINIIRGELNFTHTGICSTGVSKIKTI